ncbi:peptide deformylase [Halanaerobium congolense]|mgnify:CR=1 FL=1|jgi:peptide deformylase|uniref:Peptide deformylase n=1 Tax=Halanaerobium congolense TaxID=54121 RepID=A0A1G6HPB7_9FIRM|nr:peptide deformylase [Halanaerobium congolense]PXV69949.1 peptide deformylase [Halanaerobium congolense]TDS33063.1 peptide deformylase [Halanaerobium congolense]TDX48157.1 peptide deformylase [Halanaerobium congolense]SDB95988.1 peptide deformylase [Halanaerobium congolense]SDH33665.1 peptide deformylase [Halanaerobium congolense]
MALLQIREIGDPVLRSKSKKIDKVTKKTNDLIDNMFDTMYEEDGVGLAAPQVGILKRIAVVDIREDNKVVLINPEIIEEEGKAIMEEGCLSIPGETGDVIRSQKIKVRSLNREGKQIEFEAEGFEARAIQHEMDHLDGVLFVDKIVKLVE